MTMARPMTGIHIALATSCKRAVRSMSTAPCSWSRSLSCVVTVVRCREASNAPHCSCMLHGIEPNVITNIGTSQGHPTAGPGGARRWEAETYAVGGTCAVGENACGPHRASAQHDRPLAREEHTPVAVPFHGVRQSLAFGVAAGGDEVLGREGVVDLDELLGDDGALVEFAVDEVSGRPDGLHSP